MSKGDFLLKYVFLALLNEIYGFMAQFMNYKHLDVICIAELMASWRSSWPSELGVVCATPT